MASLDLWTIAMTFKVFFVEKVLPNFFVWAVAYIGIGKLLFMAFPQGPRVDWNGFVDVASLLVFIAGVISAVVLAYLFAKKSAQAQWFFAKVREEASIALVNFSSISLIVGGSQLASRLPSVDSGTILLLVLPFVGFVLAWRAL